MSRPDFEDLPFYDRPDLTPYLIHLTKNTAGQDGRSALDNLVNILETGTIWGTKTYVKGPNPAACWMDIPFYSLKHVLNEENTDTEDPRYEPFGVFVRKTYAYRKGCRPVWYISDDEVEQIKIPKCELWRVVKLELSDEGCVSWLHEREWRAKGEFPLPSNQVGVLVHNPLDAEKLQELIATKPERFKAKRYSIIPLTVLCQGLPLLRD